jgi:hypothetical protein
VRRLNILLFLFVAAALPTTLVALALQYGERVKRYHSPRFYLLIGLAWQVILSIPAGLLQAFHYIAPIQDKSAMLRLAVPVIAAPINAGGFSVRVIFEALAGPPAPFKGPNLPGVMQNYDTFLVILAIQMSIIALAFQYRWKTSGKGYRDPVLWVAAVVLLMNSFVNAAWPWWGR